MTPSLIIGGVDLSVISWLDIDVRVQPIGGSTLHRMASGAGFKISHWRKFQFSISATGWIPVALLGVDYTQPFEVELPFPVALMTGQTLPAGLTTRAAPWNEITITDQQGRSQRHIWVKATVFSDGPALVTNNAQAPSWEIVCEMA